MRVFDLLDIEHPNTIKQENITAVYNRGIYQFPIWATPEDFNIAQGPHRTGISNADDPSAPVPYSKMWRFVTNDTDVAAYFVLPKKYAIKLRDGSWGDPARTILGQMGYSYTAINVYMEYWRQFNEWGGVPALVAIRLTPKQAATFYPVDVPGSIKEYPICMNYLPPNMMLRYGPNGNLQIFNYEDFFAAVRSGEIRPSWQRSMATFGDLIVEPGFSLSVKQAKEFASQVPLETKKHTHPFLTDLDPKLFDSAVNPPAPANELTYFPLSHNPNLIRLQGLYWDKSNGQAHTGTLLQADGDSTMYVAPTGYFFDVPISSPVPGMTTTHEPWSFILGESAQRFIDNLRARSSYTIGNPIEASNTIGYSSSRYDVRIARSIQLGVTFDVGLLCSTLCRYMTIDFVNKRINTNWQPVLKQIEEALARVEA